MWWRSTSTRILWRTRAHLAAAGLDRVQVVCGDGGYGYPDAAPYDRIILTVGAWDIAPAWQEQLKPDGRILLPLSLNGPQMSVALAPADGHLASVSVAVCGFMGLRGAFAGPEDAYSAWHGARPGDRVLAHARGRRCSGLCAAQRPLPRLCDRHHSYGCTKSGAAWGSGSPFMSQLLCGLSAKGVPAERGLVPFSLGSVGLSPFRFTNGVLDEKGLCVLMRPHGLPPAADAPDLETFELYVRSFGPDDALAQHFIEQLAAWDAAGRPAARRLWIKAYPLEQRAAATGKRGH